MCSVPNVIIFSFNKYSTIENYFLFEALKQCFLTLPYTPDTLKLVKSITNAKKTLMATTYKLDYTILSNRSNYSSKPIMTLA